MKRYGNLWQDVCSLENLRKAHHSARKGKSHYKAKDISKNPDSMTPYQIANGAGSYWGWCKYGGGKSLWHSAMTAEVRDKIASSKVAIKERQKCL